MSARKFHIVKHLASLIFSVAVFSPCHAQQSVIDLFKSDQALAEQHFAKGDLKEAIRLFERANKSNEQYARIGRGYYLLKEYDKSVAAYGAYIKSGKQLEITDLTFYAEVLLTLKHYDMAEQAFRKL